KVWHKAFLLFYQAEDGIRTFHVTGVQTCALPILLLQEPHPAPSPVGAPAPGAKGARVTSTPSTPPQTHPARAWHLLRALPSRWRPGAAWAAAPWPALPAAVHAAARRPGRRYRRSRSRPAR